jgi:hypothetical protein
VDMLSVEQIAEPLNDSLGLLAVGSRTVPARQQTLRATLAWSYNLLSEPEQRLFARFSVFAGGWNLEAAEAICTGKGIADGAVLRLLRRLVIKHLFQWNRSLRDRIVTDFWKCCVSMERSVSRTVERQSACDASMRSTISTSVIGFGLSEDD